MKRFKPALILVVLILFVQGCVSVPTFRSYKRGEYTSLKKLCSKYGIDYNFRVFYEDIRLKNKYLDAYLKLGSNYILVNSRVVEFPVKVAYDRGSILVPYGFKEYLENLFVRQKSLTAYLPSSVSIKRIVIDPGHGGKDPGAISPWGLKEKTVNLDIAIRLKRMLEKKGFKVFLTRTGDYFVSLKNRVKFARWKKADLFISVHANANHSRSMRGMEVYYLSRRFTDPESKALAAAENLCEQEKITLTYRLKKIVGDMLNVENRRESLLLCRSILKEAKSMGIKTRRAIGAPFYVLKYNYMPAVLVETGYLTNKHEERMFRNKFYRTQIAQSIAEGVYYFVKELNRPRIVSR